MSTDVLMTESTLQYALAMHLAPLAGFRMHNVHVLDSPWESDTISVSMSRYWTEYEIKLSVPDYRADFQKRVSRFSRNSERKHDLYKRNGQHSTNGWKIAKPAYFYFVVPSGLLNGIKVPDHCGILEFDPSDQSISRTRIAPRLKTPTQLSTNQLFNLTSKLAARLLNATPAPDKEG